jgi:type I restriction enzyme M protein
LTSVIPFEIRVFWNENDPLPEIVQGVEPGATIAYTMPKETRARAPAAEPASRAKGVGGGLLTCPIRGLLKASKLAADGLTFSEEKRRIDFVTFLLAKGYPPRHIKVETTLLKFGNKGRNAFRTDVAVFDVPVSDVPDDVELRKEHVRLVAEIKRDNADAKEAKITQVRPALDFIPDVAALAVYWDDVEQRLFYKLQTGTKTKTLETAAAVLPPWGRKLGTPVLTSDDLRPTNIRTVFERIEDSIHAEVPDKGARFEIMLQLLLTKLHDEHLHPFGKSEMSIQDLTDSPASDPTVKANLEKLLSKAVDFYGKYLPEEHPVPKKIQLSGAQLRAITRILAPITIFRTRREVIQDFYMYFAQHLFKWDMAQYFTPTQAVDFIVSLVNPEVGDTVRDPACGSGDFLISALHYVHGKGGRLGDAIWGSDNSPQAIRVCVLNMVLNGDGKSLLRKEDSLVVMSSRTNQYSAMLCNPPFGVHIVEKRHEVLREFSMGHAWERNEETGELRQTAKTLDKQQTGMLFAELCIRQTQPGGRIGLVVPNGYLGNTTQVYVAFREWILRHTRLVAVVGFPRFTFKKSGADVSASALLLERREDPLDRAVDSEDYPFHAGLLECVGWSAGDSRGEPIYKRDPLSGALILDEKNEPILDADFDRALRDFRASDAARAFPWAIAGVPAESAGGWSARIRDVLARPDLSIDPKRWSKRCHLTRDAVMSGPHFRMGDVLDVIPEVGMRGVEPATEYGYVEIEKMVDGAGVATPMRGWELSERAKHAAAPGDIFVVSIWSSLNKWYLAPNDCTNVRVTNGCHRLRLKPNKQEFLVDLLAALSTETYAIQARAFCTGSGGLAELSESGLYDIVAPRVTDRDARKAIQASIDLLRAGSQSVPATVAQLIRIGRVREVPESRRTSHMVQV